MKRWQEVASAAVSEPAAAPQWSDDVPHCDDDCPNWDGRRCRVLGRRPVGCEPVVAEMGRLLHRVMP